MLCNAFESGAMQCMPLLRFARKMQAGKGRGALFLAFPFVAALTLCPALMTGGKKG